MKTFFAILVPICLLSFIAFAITAAFTGAIAAGQIAGTIADNASDWVSLTEDDFIQQSGEMTITESYDKIDISVTSFDVNIIPVKNADSTRIITENISSDKFEATVSDNTLRVKTKNIVIGADDFLSRLITAAKNDWNFDNFWSDGSITVEIPEKEYEMYVINLGSGKVHSEKVNAVCNSISMGSGQLEYIGGDSLSDEFAMQMGSGSADISGINTQRYQIDIGSGNFNVNGINGSGEINMGSGNGTINYSELNGDAHYDVASGNLKIGLKSDASARIESRIGSGNVKVNIGDEEKKMGKKDHFTLNGGKNTITVELGSGNVKFNVENPYSIVTTTATEQF